MINQQEPNAGRQIVSLQLEKYLELFNQNWGSTYSR